MSQLSDFIQKAKGDSNLSGKIKAATSVQQLIDLAKGAGYTISESDLKQSKSKLSDKELEAAAGGGAQGCVNIDNTKVCTFTGVLIC